MERFAEKQGVYGRSDQSQRIRLVGRLSALSLLVLGLGCDPAGKEPAPVVTKRSEAIVAPSGATNPAASTAVASAKPVVPAAPKKLCVDQAPHSAPKGAIKTLAAPGAEALPGNISFGVGKWVWVNLWAAWCGPCKEELPRIVNFHSRLRTAGVMVDVAFVSLDDDERQLQRFLESQPEKGVRASYWLPEGGGRDSWIQALGAKNSNELPVHALIAPSGQVACLIQGAVEDSDYAAIAKIMGATQ